MEIKLTEQDLQEASTDYLTKLGLNLVNNDVRVVISQSKVAIVTVTAKEAPVQTELPLGEPKQVTKKEEVAKEIEAPKDPDSRPKVEPADSSVLFAKKSA